MEVDLDAYGRDYRPDEGAAVGDRGIRGGDRHVARHDPLRGRVAAASGALADVQLGVDPGTFYCADQLVNLIVLARELEVATGFIHVPPDRDTGAAAAAAEHLHDRAANLEQCARVVAVALRGMFEGTGEATVVLTGFGPFAGVADNPTAAFVGGAGHVEAALRLALPGARAGAPEALVNAAGVALGVRRRCEVGGRAVCLVTAVLELAVSVEAALAGRYVDSDTMEANFRRLIGATIAADRGRAPAGVVSLGVDSGQALRAARPAFRVETQTRGFHQAGRRGRTATAAFQRTLDLARIFMRARGRGDALLGFEA